MCRRNPQSAIWLALLLLVLCPLSSAQDDPFAAGVRTTPWLSPADEQKSFQLPPGFEIQLVAAEPDIQKPLNMAFDERGRIWLTCSVEYPYAAPLDKPGRDSIRVLEDTDGDGRFEKVTVFADGLNIPIGIYPWKGGCVAWSIPHIWHFEDTDGDGKCDKRTPLYGPFDHTRDVHGNCNAFRRGFDGWVYACHGFNNDSHVKGKDGHEVHLNSGNTFRFKLDGSRIEHFTHGQVNPFGMCFDEMFNIFTADCHSKPIYQLLQGGNYPSFGKPHDGLGFVPPMMEHLHGSTAICGLVHYTGENFPWEYRGDFLSGNVMTSRINRNKPGYHGSTIKALEQADFLSTSDPWFRPVDLQVGPDGALYILDFYNRIIGHYEVPLPHPGRDRTSGRIWRVSYRGGQPFDLGALPGVVTFRPAKMPGDLTKMNLKQLLQQLNSPQLEHRLRVLNYLADVRTDEVRTLKFSDFKNLTTRGIICGLWLQQRLDGETATDDSLISLLSEQRDVAVHATKLLAEFPKEEIFRDAPAVKEGGKDEPFQTRAFVQAVGRHGSLDWLPLLLHQLSTTPESDPLLAYATRRAIRDLLAKAGSVDEIKKLTLRSQDRTALAEISLAVNSPVAASLLIQFVASGEAPNDKIADYLQHAARFASDTDLETTITLAREKFAADIPLQASILGSLHTGVSQRSDAKGLELLLPWGEELAKTLLADEPRDKIGWTAVPIERLPPSENPWVIAPRPSSDGDKDALFFYSLPKGEQRTGIYRSGPFAIPEKLSFWCAGHSGFPGKPLNDGNYVRLRDAATHRVLAESRPPRNDIAQRIEWDLQQHAGKQGYIELVDGDTGSAYAWLAVGRFSLPALNPDNTVTQQQLAADIAGKLKLASLRPQLATLIAAPSTDGAARAAIGQALVAIDPDSRAAALVSALNDPSIPAANRVRMGYAITVDSDQEYLDNLRQAMKLAPARLQSAIAETLAGDLLGAEALLALVESGHASPRLLLAPNVSAKFGTLNNETLDMRVAALTSRLPAVSETLDKLIAERRASFAKANTNLERGQAIFTKHCAGCHQISGKGSLVGPQLDGIGLRGLERIIEDILDPNRNVDVAFRTTTIRKTDGQIVSGLLRREEGAQIVLADNQGKEFTVAKDDIEEQQKTALSLMPANVPEIVSPDEFHDLIGYLLAQRESPPKP